MGRRVRRRSQPFARSSRGKTPQNSVAAVAPKPQAVEPPPAVLPTPDPKPTGPAYFGMKLTDPSVVFVIDRGSATHDSFEYMKMACLNALDSFQPDQKYQIVFWKLDKDKDPVVISPGAHAPRATRPNSPKTAKSLDDVTSFGQSDLRPALDKAFAAKPAAVVIATGKPLDDGFVKTVMDARKGAAVKVHCLSMVERSAMKPMQDVAKKTGGTFQICFRCRSCGRWRDEYVCRRRGTGNLPRRAEAFPKIERARVPRSRLRGTD